MSVASLISASLSPNVICDSPTPLTNFDGTSYMGTWIEQDHVKNEPFQENDWTCTQAVYSNLTADGYFDVYNSSQNPTYGPRFGVNGSGYCPNASG